MFVRTLARHPEVSDLVDAGRPFEKALANVVRRHVGTGFTLPKLRRMRTITGMPAWLPGALPTDVAQAVADTPDHMLPGTIGDWWGFLNKGAWIIKGLQEIGVDPATALGGVPLDWCTSLSERPYLSRRSVNEARDMAMRAARTLLPACGIAVTGHDEGLSLAGRLLFGGMSMRTIDRLQSRWHAGLARFEAVAWGRDDLRWPALFEPFRGPGDTEVRCLTSSDELSWEGLPGEDPNGVRGLSHCIAGYAPDCICGRTHVASITGPGPGGKRVRLSSLQIDCRQGRVPMIVQHRGRENAEPCESARAAARALMDAILDRTHPIDGHAASGAGGEGIAGELPTAELAFEAWRPYLPRAIARGGHEGLAAAVAGMATR